MKLLARGRWAGFLSVCLLVCHAGLSDEREAVVKSEKGEIETLLFEPVDAARQRPVPVKVYRIASPSPKPLVLFSHGLGGSREGNPYLGNHWSANGYVAVFLQHPGSDRSVWENEEPARRMGVLKEAAGLKQMLDRFQDVPFVIDQLEKWNAEENHPLHGAFDLEHIGLAGHSFGAVTTMGLAGRRFPLGRNYHDERIDAFLPMSPQPGKGMTPSDIFGHLSVPILCMTGTEDGSPIDPSLKPEARREVYVALPPGDKYQIVFEGAHHFTFGDDNGGIRIRPRNPNHHPAILSISTKFWDAYLKDDETAKKWLQSIVPRQACKLDEKDVWEWK